jgi:hypothetical protein
MPEKSALRKCELSDFKERLMMDMLKIGLHLKVYKLKQSSGMNGI